ncbi:hypothetical protein D9M71_783960 [compost metagenome]
MPLLGSATIHIERDFRSDVARCQFFSYVVLRLSISLVSSLTVVTQGHFRILFQPSRALLQEDPHEVISRGNTGVD